MKSWNIKCLHESNSKVCSTLYCLKITLRHFSPMKYLICYCISAYHYCKTVRKRCVVRKMKIRGMLKPMIVDSADIHRAEGVLRREKGGIDCHLFNVHLKNNYQ